MAGNAFLNNGRTQFGWSGWGQAAETGGNRWDDGARGNYWSDYTGPDANGDGIGDSPRQVGGTGLDRFPLMSPPDFAGALCPLVLSSPRQSAPAAGAALATEVVAPSACAWNAVSNADWITVAQDATAGYGTFSLAIAANPGAAPRTGTVDISGRTITITQEARPR